MTGTRYFAALRATEDMLGIAEHLGCASGTLSGATCPAGTATDLRTLASAR